MSSPPSRHLRPRRGSGGVCKRRRTVAEASYLRSASKEIRDRILEEEDSLSLITPDSGIPMRFRVLMSGLQPAVKVSALKKVEALIASSEADDGGLCASSSSNSSHQKLQNYVDAMVNLPIGKYASLPVSSDSPKEEISAFLADMAKTLDESVYGHASAKGHIMRTVAQWILNPKAKGLVLGIHGPPGVGKTALCKAVCDCLTLPFAFIPLGGAHDSSVLEGHSFTYEGSSWGKLADVIMKTGCMNPVLYFDELDKVSETKLDVTNVLIHLTDPTQNDRFSDKYFMDIDLDLSRSLMIFSYNDETLVHPVLRDRLVTIKTQAYTQADKATIALKHLLPSILQEFALAPDALSVEPDALQSLLQRCRGNEGVRPLKRALHDIVSHLNYATAISASASVSTSASEAEGLPKAITLEHVETFLPPPPPPPHTFMSMYS